MSSHDETSFQDDTPVIDPEQTPAEADVDTRVATLEQEREALADRLLRLQAEFDNYRKRTDRERREYQVSATERLIEDLLPALDALDQAISTLDGDAASASYRQGLELVRQQLLDVLSRYHVTAIDATGAPFDPTLHEAIARVAPDDAHPEGTVFDQVRKGYRIGERLLRPAMVRVAQS